MPRPRRLHDDSDAIPGEGLRCRRTDGRKWRCSMRAMDGVTFCEHHYNLTRRNLAKHKGGPTAAQESDWESPEPPDAPARKRTRKGASPTEETITAALKRRMDRKGEREERRRGEARTTRVLPNGLMTIASSPVGGPGNEGSPLDRKLGFDEDCSLTRRCIRSKNAEPIPVGPLKKLTCGKGLGRGRKWICHRCGEKKVARMVRCLSCRKRFFCSRCIKKQYSEMSEVEVKIACPVCRGCCDCKTCSHIGAKDGGCKIYQKQLNELEFEVPDQGRRFSGIQLQVNQAQNELVKCNCCRTSLVDFHRSCSKCSYRLCLSCCRKIPKGSFPQTTSTDAFNYGESNKAHKRVAKELNGMKRILSTGMRPDNSYLSMVPESKENSESSILCPPKEFGGCGDGLLNLVFTVPFNWSNDLGRSAEEVAFSNFGSHSLHAYPHRTSSVPENQKIGQFSISLQEAMDRKNIVRELFYLCPHLRRPRINIYEIMTSLPRASCCVL
ncbi:E3 ubiquitin-protein ligase JMJ24-like isoform X2 [Musa acuminata AAA Group]|uniref:E3 ubiquitin-protein ligase JMJ24-like isoform X2 n=1 Tax=Musa acuminata AAA Group TaxID=214697 RepID=UPI0031D42DB4